ncbi:MAG: glycoside hydrolase [Phyllobacteriaceae bacterium]|nr:glycoside hydrolase [Phyllobacteriaceae bacterium]MBA91126.1 glycoside hydrolase [Phyllobacteriaceae bacterium]
MRRAASIALFAIVLAACTSTNVDQALDLQVSVSSPRFADNDPHDWSGRTPWHYPVHGIDVAKYQGQIDWQKARQAGVSFAFIKATEGGDRLDERFHANWQAAKRAGIPRGAYHFFYFCRPAFEQALWFRKNVPVDRTSLPPVLDMEWNHKSPTCTFRPKPDAVRKEMDVFLRQVSRHYGKTPVIYTTVDFYEENQLWKIRGYPFWLRSVAGHPSQKYGEQNWTFWQYTGTGVVPGIKGNTDINVFHGSQSQWRQWVVANTR